MSTHHILLRISTATCFGYTNSRHGAIDKKIKSFAVQLQNVVRELKILQ